MRVSNGNTLVSRWLYTEYDIGNQSVEALEAGLGMSACVESFFLPEEVWNKRYIFELGSERYRNMWIRLSFPPSSTP